MSEIIEGQTEFLRSVKDGRVGLADRRTDRVRQKCRVAGLVRWGKEKGDSINRWRLTADGIAALMEEPL